MPLDRFRSAWASEEGRIVFILCLSICADLEIAKKIIAAEPQLPGDLSPPEKLKELKVFSVREQYLSLRKALGAVASPALHGEGSRGESGVG